MNTTHKLNDNSSITFQAAYQILIDNAALLQAQQEQQPDIDNLMSIVEESIAAYKVCQSRIDAVQQALDLAFTNSQEIDMSK